MLFRSVKSLGCGDGGGAVAVLVVHDCANGLGD